MCKWCKWRASVGAAIFVSVIAAPATATPIGAARMLRNLDWSIEKARLVCDEFARCWQSQPAPYGPRTSQRYIYNQVYPYSGYGSVDLSSDQMGAERLLPSWPAQKGQLLNVRGAPFGSPNTSASGT